MSEFNRASIHDYSFAYNKPAVVNSGISNIDKQIQRLEQKNQELVMTSDSDIARNLIQKPVSNWDANDYIIGKLNPGLVNSSRKIDNNNLKIQQLQAEKMNLQKAQEMLMGSVDGFKGTVQSGSDAQQRALALQKAISVGAAQGTAGSAGASLGQMANIQGKIENQYRPSSLQIESQRQQGMGQAAQMEQNIPQQLSQMKYYDTMSQGQAIQNQANLKKLLSTYNAKKKTSTSTQTTNELSDMTAKILNQ